MRQKALYSYILYAGAVILCLFSSGNTLGAQDILTAEAFFDRVSEQYGQIQDYRAAVQITQGTDVMKGHILFKSPNLIRIDFSQPAEQTIVSDGEVLTVYIPQYRVTMTQKLKKKSQAAVASMASKQGLQLLKKNYSVAYAVGPNAVPLEEGSQEMVVKLILTWRSSADGFRQIDMSVGKNNLIRRIEATTIGYSKIVFDFKDVRINQNIPAARFKYDAPASANVFDNFLFQSEE